MQHAAVPQMGFADAAAQIITDCSDYSELSLTIGQKTVIIHKVILYIQVRAMPHNSGTQAAQSEFPSDCLKITGKYELYWPYFRAMWRNTMQARCVPGNHAVLP